MNLNLNEHELKCGCKHIEYFDPTDEHPFSYVITHCIEHQIQIDQIDKDIQDTKNTIQTLKLRKQELYNAAIYCTEQQIYKDIQDILNTLETLNKRKQELYNAKMSLENTIVFNT